MSAGITSCCTPCAATPVTPQPDPTTIGGGAPMKGDAPVSGGGAPMKGDAQASGGGGATCFEQAPDPVQCGQWVPAPVVVGGDTPPEPIAGPPEPTPAPTDGSSTPAAPATTPASQLPTWPQWNDHFVRLGLPEAEIAKLAAATLTDAQLAEVYERVHSSIVQSGGIPGETQLDPQAPTSAWSPQWEQRFLALGLPADFVAELKAQAMQTGADEVRIGKVYETLVAQLQSTGGTSSPTGQQPQQQGAGWSPAFDEAFRSLGMPDEVIKIYAESGAPAAGLEAAHKHAASRVQDLQQRGWMDKLAGAKADPLATWALILGDSPAEDKELQALFNASKNASMGKGQHALQLTTSLIPGGRLAQWVFGKEFVSGQEIDRTSPMELGMAALSGLALFATIRGARNLGAAWKARNTGYLQLNSVNNTLAGLGLPKTGTDAITDVALGATQTWGTKQKLISMIPGTKLHRQVIGLAHAEAAATAFNAGGAAKLMAKPEGALNVATLSQVFDDIKSGAMTIQGGRNAYLGPWPFKKFTGFVQLNGDVINATKHLKLGGNGQSQLVGLLQAGGTKLQSNPAWLQTAPNLVDDIGRLAAGEASTLASQMGGSAVRALDISTFSKDGLRPMRLLDKLGKQQQMDWFTELAANTSKQWGSGFVAPEKLQLLTEVTAFGAMVDEAGALLKGIDNTTIPENLRPLVDKAGGSIDELSDALQQARTTGVVDEQTAAKLADFVDTVKQIDELDPRVAEQLFPSLVDDAARQTAMVQASEQVLASTNAAAASSTAAEQLVKTPSAGAVQGFIGPMPAPATPVATPRVTLTADAAGRVRTPAGLEIPTYSNLVTGFDAGPTSQADIRRLAEAMAKMRTGAGA